MRIREIYSGRILRVGVEMSSSRYLYRRVLLQLNVQLRWNSFPRDDRYVDESRRKIRGFRVIFSDSRIVPTPRYFYLRSRRGILHAFVTDCE